MADGFKTIVKWGKESLEITLIPEKGVSGLKADLEEKTGVPSDRMKLMPKSKGKERVNLLCQIVGITICRADLFNFDCSICKVYGKEF